MKQEALKYFTDTHLTILGLIIFLGFFLVLLFRVTQFSRSQIKQLKNLPFTDDEVKNV